jgi:nitrate reductase / nitrite oxidoreductase, beta subunit
MAGWCRLPVDYAVAEAQLTGSSVTFCRDLRRGSARDPAASSLPRPDHIFAAIEALRVPAEYLANLFTAGDPAPIRRASASWPPSAPRCAPSNSGSTSWPPWPALVRPTSTDLYRLLAIAKYEERYVIPPAPAA